jgi:hypothetical protein
MDFARLEKRVASALSESITSDACRQLLVDATNAMDIAEKDVVRVTKQALDPLEVADPNRARAMLESATFSRDRLKSLLPRLQARLVEIEAAEYLKQWEASFREVEKERDAVAEEFRQTYPRIVVELVELLAVMKATDERCSQVNGQAPIGTTGRLLSTELTARGRHGFSRDDPAIAQVLQLPEFEHSGKMAWPPKQPPLSVALVEQQQFAQPHLGNEWWKGQKQYADIVRADQERLIANYDTLKEQQEQRR